MESGTNRGSTRRRLEGRNATKHYDYDASSSSHSPDDSSTSASASLHTRSLDLFKQKAAVLGPRPGRSWERREGEDEGHHGHVRNLHGHSL
ncbi:hypothetical protein NL676_037030 [Syzygium grande]|nr:hypothetical protein NL676_037030 [Syzygium grande]